MDESINIVLASNVKTYAEQNTIANFKTKLSSSLNFSGDWECGLTSISYTNSWYNLVTAQKITLSIFDEGYEKVVDKDQYVDSGRYDTIDELLTVINEIVQELLKDLTYDKRADIKVEEYTRLVVIKQAYNGNKILFLNFPEELCYVLGFDKKDMDKTKETAMAKYQNDMNYPDLEDYQLKPMTNQEKYYVALHPYDLSGGYHSLYVYSNIVKPSHIGNSFTQFLGLVEIPNNVKFGEQVVIKYQNPIYVPLILKEFDTIEIDIKSEFGESVPFEFGRSIITLHFRKVYKNM
jgi:hypothetical protein